MRRAANGSSIAKLIFFIVFCSRLLSGLPKYETALPFLSEDKGNDVDQFSYWLKKWGGGIKGWKMATTLQKLKDAKRQGDTEIKWQE